MQFHALVLGDWIRGLKGLGVYSVSGWQFPVSRVLWAGEGFRGGIWIRSLNPKPLTLIGVPSKCMHERPGILRKGC